MGPEVMLLTVKASSGDQSMELIESRLRSLMGFSVLLHRACTHETFRLRYIKLILRETPAKRC